MLGSVLVFAALAFHVALAVVLVHKYIRTRDPGFVWLGVALVIWPIASGLFDQGGRVLVSRLSSGRFVGFYPFSLVERGQVTLGEVALVLNSLRDLIGVGLSLVAVFYLCRTQKQKIRYPLQPDRPRGPLAFADLASQPQVYKRPSKLAQGQVLVTGLSSTGNQAFPRDDKTCL
jgi:hypothetical protein